MGKKIGLVLLLFIAINHFGFTQDKVDPRPLDASLFSDTNVYDKDFHKRHFIRGWNFSGQSKKLDSALRINYYLSGGSIRILNWLDATNHFRHRKTFQYYGSFWNKQSADIPFNGHSLYLKPYITIDTNNSFEPKPNEGTGAVFGFLNKEFGDTATEMVDNETFSVYVLNKNNINNPPKIVLSDIWLDKPFNFLNYWFWNRDKGRYEYSLVDTNINCSNMYLTINLKANEEVIPDSLLEDTILTIKVRYKTNNGHLDSIAFSRFPRDTGALISPDSIKSVRKLTDSTYISHFLGLVRNPIDTANGSKQWCIKAKLLVVDTMKHAGKFITLSAKFELYRGTKSIQNDSNHIGHKNFPFKPIEIFDPISNITEWIDSIDVVVEYHGHLDLSINYIRLETPQAQAIFRGKYDQWLAEQIDTLNKIVRDPTKNRCNMRIHRFYTQDEPMMSEWATTRYVNKLLNGLGVVEENVNHNGYEIGSLNPIGKHFYSNFLRVTDFDMLWQGLTFGYSYLSNAPYIRRGKTAVFKCDYSDWYDGWHTYINYFNFLGGYKGEQWLVFHKPEGKDTCQFFSIDPRNSRYLDTLNSEYDVINLCEIFRKHMLDNSFFNGTLYNRPWVAYLWTSSFYWNLFDKDVIKWPSDACASCSGETADSIDLGDKLLVPKKGAGRPLTGEELRLQTWTPILLGAKGLMYWRAKVEIDRSVEPKFPGTIGLLNYDTEEPYIPPGEDFVYSDSIGGDYIKSEGIIFNDEGLRWKDYYKQGISSVFRLDSLGIDSNHIYIGTKSNRAEIMKLHRWIEAVEDTLLKLKLLAWYYYGGQGFNGKADVKEIFYSQDPKVTLDTILKNYIKVDDITTRRIDNGVYDPDSLRFFLLTLFRHEDDTTMYHKTKLSEFYIGILNPRTDPLVRTFDTIRNQQGEILFIDSSMKFYSTAEYDIGVRNGNYTHIWNPSTNSYEWRDTSYWQSLWWKRQGCREIQIPLNLPTTDYLVIAKELGAEDERLNAEFWRDERFYHRVDTTFEGKGEIAVRLLPGEGKILRISVIPNDRAKIQSNLNKSLKQDEVYINCEEMLKLDE